MQHAKPKEERGARKSFRRHLYNALIVCGTLGILVPLGITGYSLYVQKGSEARWTAVMEKADRSKNAKPTSSFGMLTASGDGFAPNSAISVSFDGAPIAAGKADGKGRVSIRFKAPATAGPGLHTITIKGTAPDGAPLTLTTNITFGSEMLKDLGIPSGREIGFLRIDAIDLKTGIREDATWSTLAEGAAHVVNTPHFGEPGTCLVSAHRTMYAAPFGDLDKVEKGDEIRIYTKNTLYKYRATGTRVVNPTDMSSIVRRGDSKLVLSTCYPKYYSTSRLLLFAELIQTVTY